MAGSADTALDIEELLEAIICNLPPSEIPGCRHVCRFWNAVIAGSNSLRRQAYLQAVSPRYLCEQGQESGEMRYAIATQQSQTPNTFVIRTINPEIDLLDGKSSNDLLAPLTTFDIHIKRCIARTSGVWRNMYMTQPPSHGVEVKVGFVQSYPISPRPMTADIFVVENLIITQLGGVRLGHLVTRVSERLAHYEVRFGPGSARVEDTAMVSIRDSVIVAATRVLKARATQAQ